MIQDEQRESIVKKLQEDAGCSIRSLGLSRPAYNALSRAGIRNLGELAELLDIQGGLESVRNLGVKKLEEIETALSNYDFSEPDRYSRILESLEGNRESLMALERMLDALTYNALCRCLEERGTDEWNLGEVSRILKDHIDGFMKEGQSPFIPRIGPYRLEQIMNAFETLGTEKQDYKKHKC